VSKVSSGFACGGDCRLAARRLEARLGVRLNNRTTRKLSLTSEGETSFHSGRRLVEGVDGLEDEVAASAAHPRGLLRINTEICFGVRHLAPALIDFRQRYPDLRVSLTLTDRLVDLVAEQIDVAIRLGPLTDSNLMSRKLAEVDRVICASLSI
jgi:LysR family transcriptional activator of dmlA